MPTISRRGANVFYEDLGTGDPPIVLVHGIGSHANFAEQIDHLRRGHRVIAPDLPGFGQSDSPPERGYGITDYTGDVAWLCDRLGLQGPVVVGHSMGGAIAFEIAAARPELAAAIVLLDPIPIVPLPALREQRGALLNALGGDDYRDAFRGFAESRMFRPTDDPKVRERIVDTMCATPQHVLLPTFGSISDWSGEHLAHRIQCPVLLITAGDGLPADVARTRELVPGLELGRTVGTGHFAHVFSPEQTNAMIDQFLAVSLNVGQAAASGNSDPPAIRGRPAGEHALTR
jgi:pimeloyl-ACP methyl ester carboxylesterase